MALQAEGASSAKAPRQAHPRVSEGGAEGREVLPQITQGLVGHSEDFGIYVKSVRVLKVLRSLTVRKPHLSGFNPAFLLCDCRNLGFEKNLSC